MVEWIAFAVLGIFMLISARKVVVSADLVHSVLWLGATLLGTAGLYVVLHAEFIAAVQVLLYTGGVVTLMLFGVMLTRRLSGSRIEHVSGMRLRGAAVALAVFVLVLVAVREATQPGGAAGIAAASSSAGLTSPGDAGALGALFLTDLMLPFEVLSLLLLAAMIGAIVLARKTDP